MKIELRAVEKVAIVVVSQTRLEERDAICFRTTVEALLVKFRNFVLDLSSLPFVDNYGYSEVVGFFSQCTNSGGRLVLVGPNDRMLTKLKNNQLTPKFIKVCGSQDEAIASFG